MPEILRGIKSNHVRSALAAFDAGVNHDFGESRDYDLLVDGKRYPPKAIVGMAAEMATGKRLRPSDFSSGIGAGQGCRALYDLGFPVVRKDSDAEVFDRPAFLPGEIYRRRELHARYGGQQQGGIITPKEHLIILLITGESAEQYGHVDGFRDDGTFWYTGEGQVGDMQFIRGNAAIRNHHADGKTLHLFRDQGSGRLQYLDDADYLDHHFENAPDRDGNSRNAVVFELALRSQSAGPKKPDVHRKRRMPESQLRRKSTEELRALAVAGLSTNAEPTECKRLVQHRSLAVREYVLRRANGTCECCTESAPFKTADGRAYLEPHHTRRVADGGPDHPRWVAALCPNCHARVHYGADGNAFNAQVIERLGRLEPEL